MTLEQAIEKYRRHLSQRDIEWLRLEPVSPALSVKYACHARLCDFARSVGLEQEATAFEIAEREAYNRRMNVADASFDEYRVARDEARAPLEAAVLRFIGITTSEEQ